MINDLGKILVDLDNSCGFGYLVPPPCPFGSL